MTRTNYQTGKKVEIACAYCSTTFYETPAYARKFKRHFCGKLCQSEFMKENPELYTKK